MKVYGFYFRVGVIFCEEQKSTKNAKITPTRKFPRLQYIGKLERANSRQGESVSDLYEN